MNKIIIFEGPDRCGKTEIGKALANKLKLSYFKNSYEHSNFSNNGFISTAFVEANFLLDLLNQVDFKENGLILDRNIPSEWVYSKVFNRETKEELIFEIDKKLADLGAIIIYCYKDKYENFDDEVIELEKIEKLKNKYIEYLELSKIPSLILNTTDENLEKQLNEIYKWINDRG